MYTVKIHDGYVEVLFNSFFYLVTTESNVLFMDP